MLTRSRALLLIAAILIFALFARVWDITRESFWADEGWTMLLAKGPTVSDVAQTMAQDQHPPLYFIFIRGWMDAFGDSVFMTRLFSSFFSLITIAALYRLCADQFGVGAGLIAALILALTDNDIMLSREVRHYTQMAAFAVLSALFYLRYLRRPSRAAGIGWFLAAVALMYTHYLGALALAVQALHALIFAWPFRRLVHIGLHFALIGAAWFPQGLVFLQQSAVRYDRPIIFQSALPNTPETFAIVRGDLIGTHFGFTTGLLLLGLVYVSYRFGAAKIRLRPLIPTVFLALWVLVPIMAIIAINARAPILTTRNFLLVTPAIVALVAHGLTNLDRTARTWALAVLVVTSLITIDAYHIKPPYREISAELLSLRANTGPDGQLSDGELVLMDIWVDDFALRYHIGQDLGADPAALPLISLPEWREKYRENFFAYLSEALKGRSGFWLVYWGKNEDGLLDFLTQQGFIRTATLSRQHVGNTIYTYRYDAQPSGSPLATYGDLFALYRADLNTTTITAGGTVRVNLLWSALRPPPLDYSVSVFVLGPAGNLIAQQDGPPLAGKSPTLGWQAGGLYFDSATLRLPTDLPPGTYTVGVKVYFYADPAPLPVNGAESYTVGQVESNSR